MADQGNGAGVDVSPQMNVLAQYIKDFSFENPHAPRSLAPQEQGPEIGIQVRVNAKQLAETDFEVELVMEGSAQSRDLTFFKFELNYAGVFQLRNIPAAELQPIAMIECPRLLFPFARQILADAVRNGGFPQFFIGPIDFAALYRQRLTEAQQGGGAASQPS